MDIYGREIQLELIQYLRPEKKFNSFEELKLQIQTDALNAKEILASHPINHIPPA
jgi:riboflavin kinase/FMN adenylyltransferase